MANCQSKLKFIACWGGVLPNMTLYVALSGDTD